MTKNAGWWQRPRLLLLGVVVGATALAGCLPPQPSATPAPTTAPVPAVKPPPTTAPPPALPLAPGGASTSAVLTTPPCTPPATCAPPVVEDFPDPFVLRVDDAARCGTDPAPCYYAYSTAAGFLGLTSVPVWRSADLTTWHWVGTGGNAMPNLASWVQFGGNWAPSVLWRPNENRYVMYYTAKSTSGLECVGVATSANPDGPFADSRSTPLLCQSALGGTIDPHPYVAPDESLYLSYANRAGIFARPLNSNGLTFSGGERALLGLSDGFSWDSTRIEGPSMMSTPSAGILLFYSAGSFDTSTYRVGVARCDTPLGPCHRIYRTAVLASRGSMLGPGGQTPFQLPNGSWVMAFHAWTSTVGYPAGGKRSLHFLPLTFPSNNPAVG